MVVVYRLVYNHFFDVHSKLYNIYMDYCLLGNIYIYYGIHTYIHNIHTYIMEY